MKVQELRIGNWVKDQGDSQWQIAEWYTPKKVASERPIIDTHPFIGSQYGHPSTAHVSDLKPIPLTEEWLAYFGFKKHPISHTIDVSLFEKEYKVLGITLNQGVYLRQGDAESSRHKDDLVAIWNIDMQGPIYVHYLQNLYFALTGKELEYKPE